MREPVRILAIIAILAGGLFVMKAMGLANGASEYWSAYAAEAEIAAMREDEDAAYGEGQQDEPAGTSEASEPQAVETASEPMSCAPVEAGARFAERSGISPDEIQLLVRLRDRREEIDSRAAELDTREAMITAMEARVDERIVELRGLRDEIQTLLGIVSEREEQDLERIVNLYRGMDAKDAAEILAVLDEETQVLVASRMTERSFAPIMQEMPRQAAARLTLALAARSDLPETAEELEARLEDEA